MSDPNNGVVSLVDGASLVATRIAEGVNGHGVHITDAIKLNVRVDGQEVTMFFRRAEFRPTMEALARLADDDWPETWSRAFP